MKCANPVCRTEALYLRSGTLHSVDYVEGLDNTVKRRIIWLCDACAQVFAVEPWRLPGEQLQQRPQAELPQPIAKEKYHSRRKISPGGR